jgi:GH24 family phage-related lysozyme (muramidase)
MWIGKDKPPERQFSDIAGAVAPVQKQKGAALSAIAGMIDVGAGFAKEGASFYREQELKEKAVTEEEAYNNLKANFRRDYEALSTAVEQNEPGLKTSTQLSLLRNRYSSLGLSEDDILTLEAKLGKTVTGDILKRGTIEQRALQAETEHLISEGIIHGDDSSEEVESKISKYRLNQEIAFSKQAEVEEAERAITLAKGTKSNAELEKLKAVKTEKVMEYQQELITQKPAEYDTKLAGLQKQYLNGELDPDPKINEALFLSQLDRLELTAMSESNKFSARFPEETKATNEIYQSNMKKLFSIYRDNFTSSSLRDLAQAQLAHTTSSNKLAVINSGQKIGTAIAVAELLGYGDAATNLLTRQAVNDDLLKLIQGKNVILNQGETSTTETLRIIGKAIVESTKGTETKTTPEQLSNAVNGVVKSLVKTSEEDNSDIIKFLAGELQVEGLSGVINEQLKELSPDLKQQALNAVILDAESILDQVANDNTVTVKESKSRATDPFIGLAGAMALSRQPTRDMFQLVSEGGRAVFKTAGSSREEVEAAKELNKKYSGAITTLVKSIANLEGHGSFEKTFGMLDNFWNPNEGMVGPQLPMDDTVFPPMNESMQDTSDNTPPRAESAFGDIMKMEGSGADKFDVDTAHFGVTEEAANSVREKFDKNMSETQAFKIGLKYTNLLDEKMRQKVEGWDNVPSEVGNAVLDLAYNVGEDVFKYKKMLKALNDGDWEEVAKQTLDTASREGKASRGLARRRAINYNRIVSGDQIEYVSQEKDGTLRYLREDGSELFSHKPKGGRHKTSDVGTIRVEDGSKVEKEEERQATPEPLAENKVYIDGATGELFKIVNSERQVV